MSCWNQWDTQLFKVEFKEQIYKHNGYAKMNLLIQIHKVKLKVLVAQSCPILCNPMDCSLPDSSDRGISQARILQ